MTREETLQTIADRLPRRYPQVFRGWVYIKPQVEFICFEEKEQGRAFYIKTLNKPLNELQAYIDDQVKDKMQYISKAYIINYDTELIGQGGIKND